MGVRDYKELIAWQKAMDLVEGVYRMSARFPNAEIYGLSAQIRRAAVSVPSNIAEGQGRKTVRDFLYFLSVARGSLKEVETQALIAGRLAYVDKLTESELLKLTTEVGRLITGLMNSLKRNPNH